MTKYIRRFSWQAPDSQNRMVPEKYNLIKGKCSDYSLVLKLQFRSPTRKLKLTKLLYEQGRLKIEVRISAHRVISGPVQLFSNQPTFTESEQKGQGP